MSHTNGRSARLFEMIDPRTHRAAGFCAGPGPLGECPSYVSGQPLPCAGYRLVPLRGTSINGLPFLVGRGSGSRCPLAWVDALDAEAGDPSDLLPDLPAAGPPPASFPAPPA